MLSADVALAAESVWLFNIFMIPQRHRLSREDHTLLSKKGRRISVGPFQASVLPSEDWKAAVIVGSSVSKSSVTRHKIKRRVTAVLTKAIPGTFLGLISLRVVRDVSSCTPAQIQFDIAALLARI